MATFLKDMYHSSRRDKEAHLAKGVDFNGYQHELAELVKHVLQVSRSVHDLGEAWGAHLVAWSAQGLGRDPRRHEIDLLDAFLTDVHGEQSEHINTYPGMAEARGQHGTWSVNPDRTPVDPDADTPLPADVVITAATQMPKMPAPLVAWIGARVEHMNKDALIQAVKHYRDSGNRGYGELRRYTTSAVAPRRSGGNDVSDWDLDELRTLLTRRLGPVFPHHGLAESDWDPLQQALADAVLRINQTPANNQEWRQHIGPQMQATVGNLPRIHSRHMLATFLSRMDAGTPG